MSVEKALLESVKKATADAVFPITVNFFEPDNYIHPGLSKRELFAALAMQGLLSKIDNIYQTPYNYIADVAVKQADALLKALSELPTSL